MNNIDAFVKLLISLTFLCSICESILPESSIQKYMGVLYGFIIASATIGMLLNINFDDYNLALYDYNNITQQNENYLKSVYEENLEDILRKKFNDDSVKVELTDEYNIKEIKCSNNETYENIMRYLNEQ